MSSTRSAFAMRVHDRRQLLEADLVLVEPARDGRPDGDRLLVHLLEHEVLVAALLGGLDRPVDAMHRSLADDAVEAGDPHRARVQVGHVPFLEEHHPAGVAEHRGDVPREHVLAVAQAHDEGHVVARPHEPVGLVPVEHGHGIGTVRLAQGCARRHRRCRPRRPPR